MRYHVEEWIDDDFRLEIPEAYYNGFDDLDIEWMELIAIFTIEKTVVHNDGTILAKEVESFAYKVESFEVAEPELLRMMADHEKNGKAIFALDYTDCTLNYQFKVRWIYF